jgi:hypothetical protein
MIAVIEQAGVPALRVGFTLAVIVFLVAGILIFRRRHQFFDRDPLSATALVTVTLPRSTTLRSGGHAFVGSLVVA